MSDRTDNSVEQWRNVETLRLVVAQTPDGIIVTDVEGVIRIWNDAAAQLLGFSADDAIGRSVDIVIPMHLRRPHWEGFHRALAAGRTTHGKQALRTRAVHKSGAKIYLSLAFAVLKDQNGSVIGAMATARESRE